MLAREPRVKMIYTVPDFQNPTGVTLSLKRRQRLIELANAYDVLVPEDTPYRALRYDGDSLPTLKSLDTEGRVLLPRANVAYVPGGTFFPNVQQPNHARLSFSGIADDRLVHGITQLGRLLREHLGQQRG